MKKQRLFYFCGILFMLIFSFSLKCRASVISEEETEGETEENMTLEQIPDELEQMWDENYMQEITDYLDSTYGETDLDTGKLWQEIMTGNLQNGCKEFAGQLIKKFFYEFSAGREIFMSILLLAVLSSLFTVVMDIVENQQISHLGFYFIYLLLCILLGKVFRMLYQETEEVLLSVTDFVKILVPAYAAALGMSNGASTATIYYEGILVIIWCVEEVLYHIILPAIEWYVLLSIMNGVWTGEKLNGLSEGLKRAIEFFLKAVLWIVGSIGILQAMITPVIDSLKWNTAKKLASVVPGVGNISEGISEIFVGSAILIRNGVGVFFTMMLLFLCIVPLCKIFVVSLCLKGASALGAIVNHSRLTSCSDKVAEASFLLCRVLLTGMGLFLMSIAISVLAVNRN